MIPPQLALILAQYGSKIIALLILVASLTAGYYYWKHEVTIDAYDKAIEKCNESKEKFRIDAEHFKLARQEEVNKANKQQSERVQNAIKTYIKHYESQRNTHVDSILRVKTSTTSTGCNPMPGSDQSRFESQAGIERTGESELSPGTLRQFNKVIDDIERLELKCEQILNSVP